MSSCRAHSERLGRRLVRPSRLSYWMWGGRVAFGLLPMDRFLQGHTFFVQRLHALRGVAPLHVHVTYTMGVDYGKRSRLRAAKPKRHLSVGAQCGSAVGGRHSL